MKKPVPCSIYDIRGIQEWLDEMALQGLFLKEFSTHSDRAVFVPGAPVPMRYRLDPVQKGASDNQGRDESYAEMGWTFVCTLAKSFYVYSCSDPQVPELYTDPQSLSMALDSLVRRTLRNNLLLTLFALAVLPFVLFFPSPGYNLRNLLLWENPQRVFFLVSYPVFLVLVILPMLVFEFRRVQKIRDTLAQGLPLKAKRRWNRPSFWAWYIPLYWCLYFLPRLLFPSVGWEVQGLDEAALSHSWPTTAQLEAAGPRPLEYEPDIAGYVRLNSSPFAPVQEEANRYLWHGDTDLFYTTIRYVRASSPQTARWIYQLELDQTFRNLEDRQSPRYTSRISELSPFAPQGWPGLDRLEVTQYQERGQDSWTFALLRGTGVLLVSYTGPAPWENCLPLFLEALDKEVMP